MQAEACVCVEAVVVSVVARSLLAEPVRSWSAEVCIEGAFVEGASVEGALVEGALVEGAFAEVDPEA